MQCTNRSHSAAIYAIALANASCGPIDIPAAPVADAGSAPDGGALELSTEEASAPATPRPAPSDPTRGPYYEVDPWRGFLWVAKSGEDTTLTTSASFEAESFDASVCIRGSVAPAADSSGNAMLGMNIHQAERGAAVPMTLVPTRAGVQVSVKNTGGSPLRVQVASPEGQRQPESRWCAAVSGKGGFIPWSAFNTACWDGSGKPYKREPISVAMLLVPGGPKTPQPYDFCLLRLTEADAASSD